MSSCMSSTSLHIWSILPSIRVASSASAASSRRCFSRIASPFHRSTWNIFDITRIARDSLIINKHKNITQRSFNSSSSVLSLRMAGNSAYKRAGKALTGPSAY